MTMQQLGRKVTPISSATHPHQDGLDVILLHGLTLFNSPRTSGNWKTLLQARLPENSSLAEYLLDTTVRTQQEWKNLLSMGDYLLEAVHEFYLKLGSKCRPIVFCCLGVTGIVLKQMVTRARTRAPDFNDVLDILSGLILVATPHNIKESSEGSDLLCACLDSPRTKKKKEVLIDAAPLNKICKDFSSTKNQNLPMLSFYEEQDRRKWYQKIGISKLPPALTEPHVRIGWRNENLYASRKEMMRDPAMSKDMSDAVAKLLVDAVSTSEHRIKEMRLFHERPKRSDTQDMRSEFGDDISGTMSHLKVTTAVSSDGRSSGSWVNVPGDHGYIAKQRSPRLPKYLTAPYDHRNTEFTGRDAELKRLAEELDPDNEQKPAPGSVDAILAAQGIDRPRTLILYGPGGIGKTQLAAEYVHSRKDKFPFICRVLADSKINLSQGFADMSVKLNLEDKSLDPDASREQVKAWLLDANVPWLLWLDSADDPDMLNDYWPIDSSGSVLVTSRSPKILDMHRFGRNHLELKRLPLADASSLLRTLTGRKNESQELCDRIANRLDCFPLALAQMAGIVRDQTLSLQMFESLYENAATRRTFYSTGLSEPEPYRNNIASLWSLVKLKREGSLAVIAVVTVLHHESISDHLMVIGDSKDVCQDVHRVLPSYPDGHDSYLKDLNPLISASVVRRSEDRTEFSIHRITQDAISVDEDLRCPRLPQILEVAITLISAKWPFVIHPFATSTVGYSKTQTTDRWERCAKLAPHIFRVMHEFDRLTPSDLKQCVTFQYCLLLQEVSWYYHERAQTQSSLHVSDTALKHASLSTNNLDEIRPHLHSMRFNVATRMDQPEVALLHAKAEAEGYEKLCRGAVNGSRELSIGLHHLADACIGVGKLDEAQKHLDRVKTMRKGLPDFSRHSLYSPLMSEGYMHWIKKDLPKAIEVFEQVLKDRENAYGRNDREGSRTGLTLYALGKVKIDQSDFPGATWYLQRALSQLKGTVGDMHFRTGNVKQKLADLYVYNMDLDEARELLTSACDIFAAGSLHQRELARVHFKLGKLYEQQKQPQLSQIHFQTAFNIREKFVAGDKRRADALVERDYDDLIGIWTR